MNDSLGAILNFLFSCEKQMTAWLQGSFNVCFFPYFSGIMRIHFSHSHFSSFQNFAFGCKKAKGRLGTIVKFRIST